MTKERASVGAKQESAAAHLEAFLLARNYGEARRSRYAFFYCDGSKPKPLLRGVSHEIFFALTPLFAGHLLTHCSSARAVGASLAFMFGWAVQYGVSSQFHRRRWSLAAEQFMSDLDHVAILVMVAGSYWPMMLLLPSSLQAFAIATLVGCVALGARHSFVKRGGRAAETFVAVAMVLCLAPVAPELYARCTTREWQLHCAALAQYLVGGVAYASHWPEPLPGVFGAQEVMHLLTCTGSLAVFGMNRSVIARL